MKETYYRPTMEFLLVSTEEGACVAASGTEPFTPQDGTWNTLNFNF